MRTSIILFCLLAFFLSCERKPFVEHKIKLEKKADDCLSITPSFRLNSNFGGERYEFEKCLPAGYDKSSVISERKGDTVVVRFPLPGGAIQPVLFTVTLDIDSYPRYSLLKIDEEVYTVIPSNK